MNKTLKYTLASVAGVVLSGCAHDPIIVDVQTKVPLIEGLGNETEARPIVQSKKSRKRSISLAQSQARVLERKKSSKRQTELQMQHLILELELLSLENERIREKTAYQSKYRAKRKIKTLASKPQVETQQLSSYQPSEKYTLIQESVQIKKQQIAQSLASLSSKTDAHKESKPFKKTEAVLIEPAVIKESKTTTASKKKVLFHAVYVMTDSQSWQDLWQLLESKGIADKWRGRNKQKGIYFIYVGSYARESYAIRRRDALHSRLGQMPMVVSGGKHQILASLVSSVKS